MKYPHASRLILTLALVLTAAAPALALAADASSDTPPEEHTPKVSIDAARTKALNLVPGEVVSERLAKNKQTGVWFYAFDIKATGETRNVVQEVRVDADQGVVLGVDEMWRR
jgi:uncharacterized membrane protein YkoI